MEEVNVASRALIPTILLLEYHALLQEYHEKLGREAAE
jgi:hypothetical protein